MNGQLTTEFREMKDFMDFVENSGRLQKLEYLDRNNSKRTSRCIHILEDFSATATKNHEEKAAHLGRLERDYKDYRQHALNCLRCQHSLDAIFTFTGYKNKALFPETISKILEAEWKKDLDTNLYLCKLPAPGFNQSNLTYISSAPLIEAVKIFRDQVRVPLELPAFADAKGRKKKSAGGNGTQYYQANIFPKDKRYKTKISIRSLLLK